MESSLALCYADRQGRRLTEPSGLTPRPTAGVSIKACGCRTSLRHIIGTCKNAGMCLIAEGPYGRDGMMFTPSALISRVSTNRSCRPSAP